jgi:hypothetical protein
VVTKYWWLCAANVFFALLVFYGFCLGWSHETITAPNIPAWCVIVSVMPAVVAGSLWLRSHRHLNSAVLTLLLVSLPTFLCVAGSLLFGILYLLLSLVGHGRTN